jgi:hypothetical protein
MGSHSPSRPDPKSFVGYAKKASLLLPAIDLFLRATFDRSDAQSQMVA